MSKAKDYALKRWLLKNWHFTGKVKRQGISKDGYRIVHKGEYGNLRTPYRPDRRFQ